MEYVIVTGMSGAGKSTALKILEDNGYYCVDNLPISLLENFIDLANAEGSPYRKVALGIDSRSRSTAAELKHAVEAMQERNLSLRIIFLDASDKVLIKRYKETRRSHPLSGNERLEQGIEKERTRLLYLRKKADTIIDTSELLTRDLRSALEQIILSDETFQNLMITVLSFGFKYGLPEDSDLVFDVRFLPNPYYVDELRDLTGNDAPVRDFVLQSEVTTSFLKKLSDMLEFLIPNYVAEGKNNLVISIGCTGGRHRSVTIANAIYDLLKKNKGYVVNLEHRDADRVRK